MTRMNWLGLGFLSPALIMVVLFFLAPVVLTGIFAFTSMSTATGITGGEYVLTSSSVRAMRDAGLPKETADALENAGYVVDAKGLTALAREFDQPTADELTKLHDGARFSERRDMESALKDLRDNRIRKTRDRKAAADLFKRSVLNERFETEAEFRATLTEAGVPPADYDLITKQAYSGWVWTTDNIKLMFSLSSSWRYAGNTAIYVLFTLAFNVGFGLFLAISTFYLPPAQAAGFRAIWFLPRILPPVLYVLMWKWFTWDTGFISTVLANFGISPRNWMLDTATHAWVSLVLINGFVGASMGMILFSSAIRAIPSSMLYASEVDGANRWQQVRYIILPQLRWPILFTTSYQTLSLLTSFEYILLATNGGPGRSTEVWALAAYHTALNNYGGNLQYGLGAAFALVLVVIGILASLFYLRLFNFRTLVGKPLIEG
ncbi:maltose ABC transporter permease (plasmid) [Antarctobacter heliothermus]|uniref:Maltose ABC transporter permease n=1 Tax=Antarctobacter heliothermus TaxID=74033 RepID=A0A222EB16_9RHOB|nr:sugar ABC transporter permease [Antarctobacter heliothermus]ASP23342.1 maltose ABC transporter permease [Antarctobacter heliothermus]